MQAEGPISVFDLLASRVELSTPASQRQIEVLAKATPESSREDVRQLASDSVYESVTLARRSSLLDILEAHPECELSFAQYLDMLKPMAPRQYSISSSPLVNMFKDKDHSDGALVSITYDVLEAPAWSNADRLYYGVSSSYLARQEPGVKIRCYVKGTNANFHLPSDTQVPLIMIAAGTGIAPMRGFIEERACLAAAGVHTLGPALLYFGCRDESQDFLYKDELKTWQEQGVVEVRPAFSRHGPSGSYKYVPDRLWAEREELSELFKAGAKIFVCGSASKLAKSTGEICEKIWLEKHPGKELADAKAWLIEQKKDRYVTDVFD